MTEYQEDPGDLALRLLSDLDRCEHGRHSSDYCWDCGHMSSGNLLLPPGTVIGHGIHGTHQIVVPDPAQRSSAANWYRRSS